MKSFMRKFTVGYMGLLILFIIGGILLIIFSSNEETPEIDESQIAKTPGLNTMLQVKEILTQQQLESSLINIEVNPSRTGESVVIELQGNDFVSEDMLLKDSFNIFSSFNSIYDVNEAVLSWYAKIDGKNVNVLTIQMTKSQMEKLKTSPYTDIPSIAASYTKHEQLK